MNPSDMQAGVSLSVAPLVGYQEGAVVSRTLLKRGGGTLTLFAFDAGQALSEHTAPFDAIAHVLEGEALITIAGTGVAVKAGEMVLMPAHAPHAVTAPVRFKMLLSMFRAA
jgi:quercetin dioxygenase-like cupin family protein